MRKPSSPRPSGARSLKVGETLRHALSTILLRGDVHHAELSKHNVTISEVRMSPDLRHANIFVAPLGGAEPQAMLKALKAASPLLRMAVAKAINLRYAPDLHFLADNSFDYADTINKMLHSRVVAKDLGSTE